MNNNLPPCESAQSDDRPARKALGNIDEPTQLRTDIAIRDARLAWIYEQCNRLDFTPEEIGWKLCRIVGEGLVGGVIYESEDAAIDAAIEAERSGK